MDALREVIHQLCIIEGKKFLCGGGEIHVGSVACGWGVDVDDDCNGITNRNNFYANNEETFTIIRGLHVHPQVLHIHQTLADIATYYPQ